MHSGDGKTDNTKCFIFFHDYFQRGKAHLLKEIQVLTNYDHSDGKSQKKDRPATEEVPQFILSKFL